MDIPRYTLGIDFGTLSARAILLNIKTGEQTATASFNYPHAVMDETLSDGTPLGPDWALQDPQDYLNALKYLVREILNQTGISNKDIVGIGIDFTSCSPMPIKCDGTPLCFLEKYKSNPHAYVKLWKHHAAQYEANKINEIAGQQKEEFLSRCGGKVSSEWIIPKLWQILNEAPEIYDEADYFIEASDWLVYELTGTLTRGACAAGFKAFWNKKTGYPSNDFFKLLNPKLENIINTKLKGEVLPIGAKAGLISDKGAILSGLLEGTPVAVPLIDAHVACAGVGMKDAGQMLIIMGTSSCHMLLSDNYVVVPGTCGVVEDGILPGFMGYEAGQSCVGDHFQWLVKNFLPQTYFDDAQKKGLSQYQYLTELAQKLKPGESGLLALDWWNGNRSVLVDGDLTGILVGLTLSTKPEDVFRALIEATAFGTRKIIEAYNESGLPITELKAVGGIAQKNPFIMQIYADVTNLEIAVINSSELPARSAAIFGAAVAGNENGGYDNIYDAMDMLAEKSTIIYKPNAESHKIYDKLYSDYITLHDYFGKGCNNVMKRLKDLKLKQKSC